MKKKEKPKRIVKLKDLSTIYPKIWDKKFNELGLLERNDFLSAADFSFLSEDKEWGNYDLVVERFEAEKLIHGKKP